MSNSNAKKPRTKDPRLVENCIYKVSSGKANYFDVRVRKRINGKQVSRFKRNVHFLTPARQLRDQYITELNNLHDAIENGNLTWKDALAKYFEYREVQVEHQQVAFKTFLNQKQTVEKHTASWGDIQLSNFKQEFISQDLQEKLKNYPKSTVKSILKHIRAVFEYYFHKANSPLSHNPCKGIKIWGKTDKSEVSEIPKMSMDEIKLLLDFTEKDQSAKDVWHPIFFIAYHTGMRSGELWALKWDDIDDDFKTIKVKRSYCFARKNFKPPKNKQGRDLSINNSLENFLRQHKARTISHSPTYVLPHPIEWENGGMAKVLRKYQKHLKISQTSFHSIRASHITHLLLNNVPPIIVQYLAGHSSYQTTERYVREVYKERVIKNATDVLDEVLKGKVLPFKKEG